MAVRIIATEQLASLLGVLSHPHRVRIIEELRHEERDVNALAEALGVRHSRVSQHLSLLRSHHLVVDRRDGRHVYYHLANPQLAQWLLTGLDFIEAELIRAEEIRASVEHARTIWSAEEP
ncbi:MAG: helix-turn-helix transcriptional regulator [Alphaproteobacteria bacterium]|nr:helix-turn-helix transcriptional regulator [Alphaproteobacteria bacterium]